MYCLKSKDSFVQRRVQVVALTLITIAVYTKATTFLTVLPAVAACFTCGVFLLFTAIVGLFAVVQHNQAVLFFVSLTSQAQ